MTVQVPNDVLQCYRMQHKYAFQYTKYGHSSRVLAIQTTPDTKIGNWPLQPPCYLSSNTSIQCFITGLPVGVQRGRARLWRCRETICYDGNHGASSKPISVGGAYGASRPTPFRHVGLETTGEWSIVVLFFSFLFCHSLFRATDGMITSWHERLHSVF